MDKRVLDWLKIHKGKIVSSPRKVIFDRDVKDFEIVDIDEKSERVKIRFEGRKYPALPLTFSMFDRSLEYLTKNRRQWVPLGTSIKPQPNTVEGEIWKEPYPIEYKIPYKVASHICDILALAGIVEYGYTNTLTGRKVQGVKQINCISPESPILKNGFNKKESFLGQYKRNHTKMDERKRKCYHRREKELFME